MDSSREPPSKVARVSHAEGIPFGGVQHQTAPSVERPLSYSCLGCRRSIPWARLEECQGLQCPSCGCRIYAKDPPVGRPQVLSTD
jgi:DNA-directed RNA polymerase subunit RPC12/RpoP